MQRLKWPLTLVLFARIPPPPINRRPRGSLERTQFRLLTSHMRDTCPSRPDAPSFSSLLTCPKSSKLTAHVPSVLSRRGGRRARHGRRPGACRRSGCIPRRTRPVRNRTCPRWSKGRLRTPESADRISHLATRSLTSCDDKQCTAAHAGTTCGGMQIRTKQVNATNRRI